MFYPLSAFIAYRYAKSNKASQTSFVSFINRFSVAGIALGLMALIIVVSVMNGLEGQLKQRILGIVPHIEITKTPIISESPNGAFNEREVTETPPQTTEKNQALTIKKISETPIEGVVATMAYREAEAVVQSRSDLRGVQVHGVQPDVMIEHTLVANHMEQGRFSDLTKGSFAAIIGRSLAIKLEARVGDRLRVMVAGASVYTPFGRMPSQRLVTVVGVFDMGSQMDDKVMYMNLEDVNRLMRDPKGSEQSLRLFLDDAFNYQAVVSVLTDKMSVSINNIRTWRERQ
uniref:ABC transporter permease n=1 Tax=Alteromonas abrolhosensis TaxID=1892904 RepID=UPI003BA96CAC